MPFDVTDAVRQQTRRSFAAVDADLVIAEFESTNLPLINNNGERVHLAVLHLAAGDLRRFDEVWRLARCDWRDVLVAAGLANVDWREVLRSRGIEPNV